MIPILVIVFASFNLMTRAYIGSEFTAIAHNGNFEVISAFSMLFRNH